MKLNTPNSRSAPPGEANRQANPATKHAEETEEFVAEAVVARLV
jgi:hypothetical protein